MRKGNFDLRIIWLYSYLFIYKVFSAKKLYNMKINLCQVLDKSARSNGDHLRYVQVRMKCFIVMRCLRNLSNLRKSNFERNLYGNLLNKELTVKPFIQLQLNRKDLVIFISPLHYYKILK